MKNYKLILLEKNRQLGMVQVSDDFRCITFKLSLVTKKDYRDAFERMIRSVLNSDAFEKVDIRGFAIKNGTETLWRALVQTMLIAMKIVASEK